MTHHPSPDLTECDRSHNMSLRKYSAQYEEWGPDVSLFMFMKFRLRMCAWGFYLHAWMLNLHGSGKYNKWCLNVICGLVKLIYQEYLISRQLNSAEDYISFLSCLFYIWACSVGAAPTLHTVSPSLGQSWGSVVSVWCGTAELGRPGLLGRTRSCGWRSIDVKAALLSPGWHCTVLSAAVQTLNTLYTAACCCYCFCLPPQLAA